MNIPVNRVDFFSRAQAELSNLALGKSLVAQLQTNDENGVSLVLYDTSSDEDDVNINQVLINKLSGFPEGHAMNAFGPGGDQAQPPDAMPPLELPSGNVSGTKRMLSTLLTYLIFFFALYLLVVIHADGELSVPVGYGDLGYSGRTGNSDLIPNGTWTSIIA